MRLARRWILPAALAGAALAWRRLRRGDLRGLVENVHRYSAPTARLYDAVTAPLLGRFFGRVAADIGTLAPEGRLLEIGSGPGRLAATLARVAPGVRVTGVDIAPDMVERARSLAARSGVTDRVTFLVGDVTALPFADASFDMAVSSLSAHHWPNPAAGLAEIHRVLRPGGIARIYDVVDWIRRFEQQGPDVVELAKSSPFRGGAAAGGRTLVARMGPIPLLYRADLRREPAGAGSQG
jgi:ubiquinone/menaquinone biosynthesis C-methylase UbiE